MAYDFKNLSAQDFEDLARDLVGVDLKVRFEAFAMGPDGGMDGRHSKSGTSTILQVKHLAGSTFATLKSKMREERVAIDKLQPDRYILVTSQALNDNKKAQLATIIGPSLKELGDIYSAGDLNGLLRINPAIAKAHIKLWLSSTAVLEQILNATALTYAKYTRQEIEQKVRVYAVNPSLEDGQAKLDQYHVLIVSGPPGVGKTTLAEMLTYAYLAEGWDLVVIKDLDTGYPDIDDSKKQIIFFDDFLGTIGLDATALSNNDSELARFLKRVRKSPNARFVLTTRAYVLEAAREVSEHLADKSVNVTKYLLDVGVYNRRIKARILYNHLLESKTPPEYVRALIVANALPQIIDHANYNPRIVDWMTDAFRLQDNEISVTDYASAFINLLNNPSELWDKAFRSHIDERSRHLLYCVFFSSQYGVDILELRAAYDAVHKALSEKFGYSVGPKDFEECLKILEGSFLSLRGTSVSFVNPSVRDYLQAYLADADQLRDFARCAHKVTWAKAVWDKIKQIPDQTDENIAANVLSFLPVAQKFNVLPIHVVLSVSPVRYGAGDTSTTGRVQFLLELWSATKDPVFATLACDLVGNPIERFSAWSDGSQLVGLIAKLKAEGLPDFPNFDDLIDLLSLNLAKILEGDLDLDDLDRMSDAVFKHQSYMAPEILDSVQVAVHTQFDNVGELARAVESSSTGNDYLNYLTSLAKTAKIPEEKSAPVFKQIRDRIKEVEDETEEAEAPKIAPSKQDAKDIFDDLEMHNLFATLIGDDVPPYVEYEPELPF